jgi:HK97 family phage major capsid protein
MAVVPAADTMVQVTLTGFEFMKVIRISQTIQTMGIDAFESWIAKIIGEDIAVLIDNEIINGGTVTGNIATAQAWVNGTNQITYIPANGLAYSDITNLIALLPSAFDGNAKFLMNKATFYRQVLGMTDANGNPIAVPDIASSGRYSILGYPVLIDDNMTANEAYLGDYKQVVGNLNADIQIARSMESGFLNNSIDFRGTAIFDCDVAQPAAIVKLNV